MSRRSWIWPYHVAGRLWLTAAGLSLLLPATVRHGLWLPLHLALAGAVAVSISGNMLAFVGSLSAGPQPPAGWTGTQFAMVNAGAALVAAGMTWSVEWLLPVGGSLFAGAVVLLGVLGYRSWRRGLNRRHRLPVVLYGAALSCVLLGVTAGAVLGSGAVEAPALYVGLRGAHMTLNVLGFASLVIAGTLVTFLPTLLRVRMSPWRGRLAGTLLVAGVATQATGLAGRLPWLASAGAVAFAAGVGGLVWMAVRTLGTPRRFAVPAAAKHLVAGIGWLATGSVAQAAVLVTGSTFPGFRDTFVLVFVCGFVLQTLLGAWLFLLPMQRPAHPDRRRLHLAAVELGASAQVAVLNLGVAVSVLAPGLRWVGAALMLTGMAVALVKAWAFPWLAGLGVVARRPAPAWDPRPDGRYAR